MMAVSLRGADGAGLSAFGTSLTDRQHVPDNMLVVSLRGADTSQVQPKQITLYEVLVPKFLSSFACM